MTFNVHPSCSKSKPIAVPVLRGKCAYKPSLLNLLSSNILKNHQVRIDPTEPSTNDNKPVPQQVSLPCFRRNDLMDRDFTNTFKHLNKRQQIDGNWCCG